MKHLTKGALRKMVQEEMIRQKKLRENTVAGAPGMTYNTPKFIKKQHIRDE